MNVIISQSLATGLPVITTRHSGLPDQVKDGFNGFLANEGNWEELAEKILQMIDHPELWPEMGRNGRSHVEKNYNTDVLIDRQVEIYAKIIGAYRQRKALRRGYDFVEPRTKIKVKNSGIATLHHFRDYPDGDLHIAEANKNLPFEVKRVYFVNNLQHKKAVRGKHSHRTLHQAIFCVSGSFHLLLDDGEAKQNLVLNNAAHGILLRPGLWHEMTKFSKDCILLVFASDGYDGSDYVRNYDEFINLCHKEI